MGAQSRAEARMFTLALPKSVLIAELCPRVHSELASLIKKNG